MKNQLNNKLCIKNILMLIALIVFSVNVYADEEKKEDKFKSMNPEFYETPTRFIIIVSCIDAKYKETSIDHVSDHVYYYEVNKKTGKSLKLKGRTLNDKFSSSLAFQGYAVTYKDLHYTMYLQSNPALIITKEGEDKTIENEPIKRFIYN